VLGSLDWRTALANLRVPLLLVGGRDDFLEKDAFGSTAAMATFSPKASSVVMNAGHFPFIEQPAAFCGHVRPWIRGL
jgi:pimeloyl-ACP methyl ester carboxylesterase